MWINLCALRWHMTRRLSGNMLGSWTGTCASQDVIGNCTTTAIPITIFKYQYRVLHGRCNCPVLGLLQLLTASLRLRHDGGSVCSALAAAASTTKYHIHILLSQPEMHSALPVSTAAEVPETASVIYMFSLSTTAMCVCLEEAAVWRHPGSAPLLGCCMANSIAEVNRRSRLFPYLICASSH